MKVITHTKKKKPKINISEIDDPKKKEEKILEKLAVMKHRELQKECILRGLEFNFLVEWDHNKLASWYIKEYDRLHDPKKLDEFDIWMEEQLEGKGYKKGNAMLSPCFRMGFTGNLEEINTTKIIDPEMKKEPIVKIDKPKRVKDEELGIMKGTKKELTYKLSLEGKDMDDIILQVTKKFPEAQEKSIKIWAKRALKEAKEK